MNTTKNKSTWSFWPIFYLLLFALNIIIVGTWLVVYYEHYEKIATVIKGIWAVITAVIIFFGIRKAFTKASVSDLFSAAPFRALILCFTCFNLLASAMIILLNFEIYTVKISAPTLPNGINVRIALKDVDTLTVTTGQKNEWIFNTSRGRYDLSLQAEGYKDHHEQISLDWPLSKSVVIREFIPFEGYVAVEYKPEFIHINLRIEKDKNSIRELLVTGGRIIIRLMPGDYTVHASATGYEKETREINITSTDTVQLPIYLDEIHETGILAIATTPPGLPVYVNQIKQPRVTPCRLALRPQQHTVEIKKRIDEKYGYYATRQIDIKANRTTKIDIRINAIELPQLTIVPLQKGYRYFLDDTTHMIGTLDSPKTIRVFPGHHTLLKKIGAEISYSDPILATGVQGHVIEF